MQILLAILALGFLIVVHEFGHFIVAKLSGIKVLEFWIFMGPKLFSIKRGETTYSLRLIPIGGLVRMEGEEQASNDERAFNRKPVWIRAAVIAAGPIMNLLTALVIILVITSVRGYYNTTVDKLPTDSAAYQAGIREGDRIISYDGKKIYHPMDIELFMFGTKGKPSEVEVQRGNQIVKTKLSPVVIPENRYILGFYPKVSDGTLTTTVDRVTPNTSAANSGLKPGDKIIALNGQEIGSYKEMRDFLNTSRGEPISVTVIRNGDTQKLSITPVRDKNPEQYSSELYFTHSKGGLIKTLERSIAYSFSITRNVYYPLVWLITGKVSISQMSGPVGIVTTIGNVVQVGPTLIDRFLNLLSMVALISINLGLFNLIPFPALDGSKLLILAVEAVRRKAIPPEKEAFISLVGLTLLIMLMIFATYNDIMRLIGGS